GRGRWRRRRGSAASRRKPPGKRRLPRGWRRSGLQKQARSFRVVSHTRARSGQECRAHGGRYEYCLPFFPFVPPEIGHPDYAEDGMPKGGHPPPAWV
ncbi:unnamed protein product, partial [Ectocarpus sp. 12 AP-2014]